MVGQAVDIRQGADGGQTTSWDRDLLERENKSSISEIETAKSSVQNDTTQQFLSTTN